MAAAAPGRSGRTRDQLYAVVTAILLGCCGPIGLVALWLGPWSNRSKVIVTLVWLVIFGPATFYYGHQMYFPTPGATPTPR